MTRILYCILTLEYLCPTYIPTIWVVGQGVGLCPCVYKNPDIFGFVVLLYFMKNISQFYIVKCGVLQEK